MDRLIVKHCPKCPSYPDCGYVGRNLERKCPQLQDIAYGYELAEKDLALTWEDVGTICELLEKVRIDFCENPKMFNLPKINEENFKEAYFGEVLRRYKEQKRKEYEN